MEVEGVGAGSRERQDQGLAEGLGEEGRGELREAWERDTSLMPLRTCRLISHFELFIKASTSSLVGELLLPTLRSS